MLDTLKRAGQSLLTRLISLDVQHGKPIHDLTPRQTIVPITVVSIVFMMWGVAYGLLDIMNYHIRLEMNLGRGQAALLAAGYYLVYLPGAIYIGGNLVRRLGYRVTMVYGLIMLAVGDIFMSIAAQHRDFAGMVASHFVVGLGVSALERAANPYATNCGPRIFAPLRLLVAQALAGVGTVIAPFLANALIFNPATSMDIPPLDVSHPGRCIKIPETDAGDLTTVVTFYRGLAGGIFGLAFVMAVVFFRTQLVPEVGQETSPKTDCRWKLWKHPLVSMRYSRLWWGVAANFFNLGCQVAFAQFFIEHMAVSACASNKWAANYMAIAQGVFVVGRFTAAAAVSKPRIFRPRWVLAFFIAGAVAMTGAGTAVTGKLAVGLACMVMFFEAPSFPMIFESATAGFEAWTPTAETLMIGSICGGGVLPALMGQLVEATYITTGWWLVTGCFVLVFTYCLATCMIPSYRQRLDAAEFGNSQAGSRSDSEDGLRQKVSRDPGVELVENPLAKTPSARKYFGGAGGHGSS